MKERGTVAVGDSRVDRGGADGPVTKVVLDELEGDAGVEEVGRDRVAQGVRGVVGIETRTGSVPAEEVLDLPFPEGSGAAGEQRLLVRRHARGEMVPKKALGGPKERTLGPEAALHALDDDPVAIEINVAT